MKKIFHDDNGQTLIEALAALSIAAIVLTSIATVIIVALQNSRFVRDQDLAEQYSQEGIEIIRRIKTADWATFDLYNGLYCLGEGQQAPTFHNASCLIPLRCDPNVAGLLIREVCIEKDADSCEPTLTPPPAPLPTIAPINATRVTVSTYWTDSKCAEDEYCHEVTQTTCFTDANIKTP